MVLLLHSVMISECCGFNYHFHLEKLDFSVSLRTLLSGYILTSTELTSDDGHHPSIQLQSHNKKEKVVSFDNHSCGVIILPHF